MSRLISTDEALDNIISNISSRKQYTETLEKILLDSSVTNPSNVYWSTSYGVNLSGKQTPTNVAKENVGYTFFTRPTFNLSYNNVNRSRLLMPLLTNQDPSWMSATRSWLDSYANMGWGEVPKSISSKLVDPCSPFIPILSNELVSISGFPDRTMDFFQSTEGRNRESIIIPDGIYDISNVYPISATFKLLPGNPILYMMQTWLCLMALGYEGIISPHPIDDVDNQLNCTTSIFRIITDATKQRVVRFGRTGWSIPTTVPEGAAFSYEANTPFMSAANQIDIQFSATGWITNDVGYVLDFNRLCAIFNPRLVAAMRPERPHFYIGGTTYPELYHDTDFNMVKLDPKLYDRFKVRVYPYINLEKGWTLERWVPSEEFTRIIKD